VFVLGIDPGLTRCGYAILRVAVAMGVLRTSSEDTVPGRLAELQTEIRLLHNEYRPAVVAVEKIFFTHNASTAVGVAQASGLILAESASRGADVHQYSPTAVKSVVAGDGQANKTQVQEMVQILLNLAELPKPADAADAAALALCHLAYDPSLGRKTMSAEPDNSQNHGTVKKETAKNVSVVKDITVKDPATKVTA